MYISSCLFNYIYVQYLLTSFKKKSQGDTYNKYNYNFDITHLSTFPHDFPQRYYSPGSWHGAGAFRRTRQSTKIQPWELTCERPAEPHAQRPLQPVPNPNPKVSELREESQEGSVLPQWRPVLQGDCVRNFLRQIPVFRCSARRPHPLPVRQCKSSPGRQDHLCHRRVEDYQHGSAGGRWGLGTPVSFVSCPYMVNFE